MKPISFTEQENRHLQSVLTNVRQDAQQYQYYPGSDSILSKLETWPASVVFTEQESRQLQTLYFHCQEVAVPFQPLQARDLTFGQPTETIHIVESILMKLEASS